VVAYWSWFCLWSSLRITSCRLRSQAETNGGVSAFRTVSASFFLTTGFMTDARMPTSCAFSADTASLNPQNASSPRFYQKNRPFFQALDCTKLLTSVSAREAIKGMKADGGMDRYQVSTENG
jgi:hypothetical protein